MQHPGTRRSAAQRQHAFTLIEIMIVVLIIGMIMGLVGPNVLNKLRRAQHTNAKNQIMLLSNAVKDYYLDMAEYPTQLDDLVRSPGNAKWDGPYLDPPRIPLDPWGEPYGYSRPGQHGPYDISSYGADRAPGGTGDAADIGNWE